MFDIFLELRCSAISSPITPSIDHTVFPSLNEHMSSDFMDMHSSYQPLVQRTSMGNDIFVRYPSSIDDNGSRSNDAQVEATGTEGSLIMAQLIYFLFDFFCSFWKFCKLTSNFTSCNTFVFLFCFSFISNFSFFNHVIWEKKWKASIFPPINLTTNSTTSTTIFLIYALTYSLVCGYHKNQLHLKTLCRCWSGKEMVQLK